MKITSIEVEVPAGQYVLGDPCYAVPHDKWSELLESCSCFNNPIGQFSTHDRGFTIYHYAVAFGTRWGDGCYRGTDGNLYPVDAGLIGLVPLSASSNELRDDLSTVVTFDKPTICSTDGTGKLRFGHITIDTDPDEEDEDD
jgi:hypothetical protein